MGIACRYVLTLWRASTHCIYCCVLSISYLPGNAMLALSLWVLSSHVFQRSGGENDTALLTERSGGENDTALLTEFAFQCPSDIIWILVF